MEMTRCFIPKGKEANIAFEYKNDKVSKILLEIDNNYGIIVVDVTYILFKYGLLLKNISEFSVNDAIHICKNLLLESLVTEPTSKYKPINGVMYGNTKGDIFNDTNDYSLCTITLPTDMHLKY